MKENMLRKICHSFFGRMEVQYQSRLNSAYPKDWNTGITKYLFQMMESISASVFQRDFSHLRFPRKYSMGQTTEDNLLTCSTSANTQISTLLNITSTGVEY